MLLIVYWLCFTTLKHFYLNYYNQFILQVAYKQGLGNATVTDDSIKGTLRVGQIVQAKHADKKEFVDATITKIQDCSQYTVGKCV